MNKKTAVENSTAVSRLLMKCLLSVILVFIFFGASFSGIGPGCFQEADASVMLAPAIPWCDVGYKADYYVRNLVVDYRGGDVWLGSDPFGIGSYKVLDQLIVHVWHEDGTFAGFTRNYVSDDPPSPADKVTSNFKPGKNYVTVTIRSVWVNKQYSSGLWLTSVDLDPESLPSQEYIDEASMVEDPVDTSTGAHLINKNLLNINGAQPVAFNLQYNSLMTNEGPLGKGWGHNYETHLEFMPSGHINLCWNANTKTRFVESGTNNYVSNNLSSKFDSLIKNAEGSFTLTRKDQSVYIFNATGQLLEQRNGHGQKLTLSYNGEGRLASILEPVSGRALTVNYNVYGLVDSVSENGLNRQVSLEYFYPSRNLKKITDAKGQTTTYTYYADNRIESATDFEGVRIFYDTYDETGRVATQDDARSDNQLARFDYTQNEFGSVVTTVYDRTGQVRVLTHNSDYKLVSIKDELGNTIVTYSYDLNGNRTSASDANNKATTFTYDAKGNMLTSTDPAGNITKMTYDSRSRKLLTRILEEKLEGLLGMKKVM